MPRVVSTADTGSAALAEAARVIASLPSGLAARVDHVAVAGVDQVSLMMRGGPGDLGERRPVGPQGPGAGAPARQPGHTYDVSVPGQPVTSPR